MDELFKAVNILDSVFVDVRGFKNAYNILRVEILFTCMSVIHAVTLMFSHVL